jgi:hypothetical protein
MPAPTKAERQSDELLKTLIEANVRMVEAVCSALASMTPPAQPVYTQQVPVVPTVPAFEDIPEDDWDKPERLWLREEEEDAKHSAYVNGEPDVDPDFMAEVLKEAGFPNTQVTS